MFIDRHGNESVLMIHRPWEIKPSGSFKRFIVLWLNKVVYTSQLGLRNLSSSRSDTTTISRLPLCISASRLQHHFGLHSIAIHAAHNYTTSILFALSLLKLTSPEKTHCKGVRKALFSSFTHFCSLHDWNSFYLSDDLHYHKTCIIRAAEANNHVTSLYLFCLSYMT